jgi:purine-binding chemotaxis protein CheW
MSAVMKDAAPGLRQYLTFRLGGEEYGVGILTVKEIRGWSGVTAIPHAPPWMPGMLNLRGMVVPIIDLRVRFGLPRADFDEFTVVIVLAVGGRVAGIVVDAVSDVISLADSDVKPAPSLGRHTDTSHILGFCTQQERMRILVDVERLMAGTDLAAATRPADQQGAS